MIKFYVQKIVYPAGSVIVYLTITTMSLILLTDIVSAQNSTSLIEGYVYDGATARVINGATVYLSETTWFAESDEKGYFSLTDLTPGRYQFVVSKSGYEPHKREVQLEVKRAIFFDQILIPVQKEQTAVVESEQNREWRKNFRRFEELFIGKSENGKKTEILNPEVLSFKSDRTSFSAKADQELLIRNGSLGYEIVMDLTHFEWNENSGSVRIHYFSFFKELDPNHHDELNIWKTSRDKTYRYSPDRFFRSLIDDNLRENNYKLIGGEIESVAESRQDNYSVFNESGAISKFNISLEHGYIRLEVEIDDKTGYIGFHETGENRIYEMYIDQNGLILNPMDFYLDGIWEHYKIADKLPLNYIYKEK